MALANYADLKSAVAKRVHRTDLASLMDDFVSLAEVRINSDITHPRQEAVVTGTMATSVALPSDAVSIRSLIWVSGTTRRTLQPLALEGYGAMNIAGSPEGYVIVSDTFRAIPYTSAGTYELVYMKRWALGTTSTNWLMTNHPDVYLYATLIEVAQHTRESDAVEAWVQLYAAAKRNVDSSGDRTRWGGPIQIREG